MKYKWHFLNQHQKLYHISKAQPNTFSYGPLTDESHIEKSWWSENFPPQCISIFKAWEVSGKLHFQFPRLFLTLFWQLLMLFPLFFCKRRWSVSYFWCCRNVIKYLNWHWIYSKRFSKTFLFCVFNREDKIRLFKLNSSESSKKLRTETRWKVSRVTLLICV